MKWTIREESIILTLAANGIPLCCEQGRALREQITQDGRKRYEIDRFSYEAAGCSYMDRDDEIAMEMKEHYFESYVEWLGDEDSVILSNNF